MNLEPPTHLNFCVGYESAEESWSLFEPGKYVLKLFDGTRQWQRTETTCETVEAQKGEPSEGLFWGHLHDS